MAMDFIERDLEYFRLAALNGSITKAAQAADVQQAALTRAIQRLENQIGERLFFREPRGIRLTVFGERLYKLTQEATREWRKNLNEIRSGQDHVVGHIRFGCHLALSLNYLPTWLPQMMVEYPDLNWDVVIKPSLGVCQLVSQGELEFGLVVNPLPLPRLVVHPLLKETVAVYRHKSGSLKVESPILLYNPEMQFTKSLTQKLRGYRFRSLPSYDLVARMATKNKNLFALLPSGVAARYNDLEVYEPCNQAHGLCLIHREDLPKTVVNKHIISRIKSALIT